MSLLLLHGGLWEDMTPDRFWNAPGVVDGLSAAGFDCVAPQRPARPTSWAVELDRLRPCLPEGRFTVIGACNASTTAVELALAHPDRVTGLLLAWPATCGNPTLDARAAEHLRGLGASDTVIDSMLSGQTLRGLDDDRIARLALPTALIPAPAASPTHQRETVESLARLIPGSTILPVFPETPRPEFAAARDDFLNTVTGWLTGIVTATPDGQEEST